MVKFRYIEDENYNILDIEAFKAYRNFRTSTLLNNSEADKASYKKKYASLLHNYLDWYILYCQDILKERTIKDEHIVCHLFRPEIKSIHQFKEFLQKSIYVSKNYVQYLRSKINDDNIDRYQHTMSSLDIDLEWLIVQYEINCRKSVAKVHITSGRYPFLRPTDIYSAAKELFFIEECPGIENLYLRDLKPVVMFQIRQLLEVFARNLLGYTTIVNKNGEIIKKFTQIAWEFIQYECEQSSPRISFPFDLALIIPINKWSHSFVHSTYIYSSYVQFYALKTLGILFKPSEGPIRTYDGNNCTKYNVAAICLKQYHSLRTDFEDYIKKRNADAVVKWLPESKVGAYISSL